MSDQPWIRTNLTAKICIGAAIVALAIPPSLYIGNFWGQPLSPSPSDWGVFGDYVGGILNPIIGLLTLIATVFLAFMVYQYQRSHEGEEEALKTACDLLKEWNSEDMLKSRRDAKSVLNSDHADFSDLVNRSYTTERSLHISVIVGFFVRLNKLAVYGSIKDKHLVEIFGETFMWWHQKFFTTGMPDTWISKSDIVDLAARIAKHTDPQVLKGWQISAAKSTVGNSE